MEQAVDPSLILWENLGSSKQERNVRIFVTGIIAFLLLLLVANINLLQSVADAEIQKSFPQIECSGVEKITYENATLLG